MEKEIQNIIRFARAFCAERLPWFSPALFKCRIHLTTMIPVAAIDKYFNVYFNPKAIERIMQDGSKKEVLAQIGFLWIHEISHVLREHAERAKEMNAEAKLWNIACDLEINDGAWKDLKPPKAFPGIYPSTFSMVPGQIAEYYYKKLYKLRKEQKDKLQDLLNKIGNLKGWDEGSGVHNQSRPWETEGLQGQNLEDLERELIKRAVAKEMMDAKMMGKLPAGWLRWADATMKPKVDWRKVLRHRMSISMNSGLGSRVDYSFTRPSRRQSVYHPILTPSLRGDMTARIAVVVDTSGSMTPQQIGQAVSEICEVLKTFQVPVTVIPCDARAYEPILVRTPSDYFKLENLKGGGGTNMVVGIEAALKLKPAPDSILVLTDGYTPYPAKQYKTNVIFGIFKMYSNHKAPAPPNPPWGKDAVVEIDLSELFSSS